VPLNWRSCCGNWARRDRQTSENDYETTDYAISLQVGCNLFEWSQFLFGMENLYLYLAVVYCEDRRMTA
jgi:hypothetical protein